MLDYNIYYLVIYMLDYNIYYLVISDKIISKEKNQKKKKNISSQMYYIMYVRLQHI